MSYDKKTMIPVVKQLVKRKLVMKTSDKEIQRDTKGYEISMQRG
jgi:hypothetical protein